jgi:PDZ domain-containing protein
LRRLLTPGKLLAAFAAVAVVTIGLLFVIRDQGSYIFLPDEPHPVEPLIKVENGTTPDRRGGLFFVDIFVRHPSIVERLLPGLLHDGASIVPAPAVNPTGLSEKDRDQANLEMMTRSQRFAAAVALREAGYEVKASSNGAFITQVLPDSPAALDLHPSDVIVELDGERVDTLSKLRRILAGKKPGDKISLVVLRAGKRLRLTLELTADPANPHRAIIGVLVEQAASIRLPLKVEIDTGNVGGPSAGLAMALGLLEKLGRDVDHGRRVAATGAIELDGSIGPVGGVKQKTIGAREDGIQIFLVPAGDNAQEARRYRGTMRVVAVRTFQQALRALATQD